MTGRAMMHDVVSCCKTMLTAPRESGLLVWVCCIRVKREQRTVCQQEGKLRPLNNKACSHDSDIAFGFATPTSREREQNPY